MDSLGLLSGQSLQALSNLLSPQEEHRRDECQNVPANLGPGHIGPQAAQTKDVSSACLHKDSKDIWSEEEVAEGPQYEEHHDSRAQPEYEIVLKQTLGTEDLFLGLSGKDPSSMSCEALLVKIKLPDTKAAEVFLEVKDKFLDLRTAKYRLGLHLPQPVHGDRGTARFCGEAQELQVTLPMQRPLGFLCRQ
ncbi:dynein axonemal assembly factor 6 isoform X2 [Takifugu rubripes]|uniref:dynein axonemal assembly factor 6 isoform X2 n=1 Tax=Takifugu rubripes TaxID=31033 RepID=UPI000298E3FE|nr:protein PIH1D3 isoform X2 [Takifugu rubripes]XP_056912485.1 protein PIH1D3 isoform X2 [Takifugu flavidus]|eukprot:XP_003976563.1 PREDICTED: protein PIH1D3 [Takifugu rubripes]